MSCVKKPAKRVVKLTIEIEIPFEEYSTVHQNRQAIRNIKDYFVDMVVESADFVPLYVDGEDGATGKSKSKVTITG